MTDNALAKIDEIESYRKEDEQRLNELLLELRQEHGDDMQSVLDAIGAKNRRRPFSCYGWLRGRSISVEFPHTEAGWRALKFLVEDLEARKRAKPKSDDRLLNAYSTIDSVLRPR